MTEESHRKGHEDSNKNIKLDAVAPSFQKVVAGNKDASHEEFE